MLKLLHLMHVYLSSGLYRFYQVYVHFIPPLCEMHQRPDPRLLSAHHSAQQVAQSVDVCRGNRRRTLG